MINKENLIIRGKNVLIGKNRFFKSNITKNLFINNFRFILLILLFFGFVLLESATISAYSRSAPAYTFGHQTTPYLGGQFPLYNQQMCGAGQDFILQIDPLGCINSPVRSDLLEEQDVVVFCPVYATQLNPLIKIENINHITISSKNIPKEVLTVGYYPARAAIGKWNPEITRPVFDNIGYATIVLRQQRNESAMPDFVEGNLTAIMRYNIKNAFGTGRTIYYLPQLTDEEWNRDFTAYGFWNGRGYLRLEGADNEEATIGVYSDFDVSKQGRLGEKTKIATLNLKVGKSDKVFMPGFDYCRGAMKVTLVDLENPATRARIRIDSDVFELSEGEKFLENACVVREIRKQGINNYVKVSCKEDEKNTEFVLRINPKIKISIDNVVKEVTVGEKLYDDKENNGIYLGFVGNNGSTNSPKDLYIRLVAIPKDRGGNKNSLSDSEILYVASYDKAVYGSDIKANLAGEVSDVSSEVGAKLVQVIRQFFTGKRLGYLHYLAPPDQEIFGSKVDILGYAGVFDADLDSMPKEVRNNYEKALEDYRTIKENFAAERWPEGDLKTLGEKALNEAIDLSDRLGQRKTVKELCQEFSENYNSAVPDICNNDLLLSNTEISGQSVLINGRTHILSLEGVKEPSADEFGLDIKIVYPNGNLTTVTLTKNEIFYLDDRTGESIQLSDLTEDTATLKVNLATTGIKGAVTIPTQKLRIGSESTFESKYIFSIEKIRLQRTAKVTLEPEIDYAKTNATFNFKIGIEKRAIKLSPDKTKERIQSLNSKIEKLTEISDNLGKVVSTGKTACAVTAGALTLKNFFTNLAGKGIARQKVMRGEGGWYDWCQKEVNNNAYDDIETCLLKNSAEIEASVNAVNDVLNEQNEEIKELEEGISKTSFLGEKVVNTDQLTESLISDSRFISDTDSCINKSSVVVAGAKIKKSDIIINQNTTSLTQARDLQLYCRLLDSEGITGKIARTRVDKILGEIYSNSEPRVRDFAEKIGLNSDQTNFVSLKSSQAEPYKGLTYKDIKDKIIIPDVSDDTPIATILTSDGREYSAVLIKSGNDYAISKLYDLQGKPSSDKLDIYFKTYDDSTYKNHYSNPVVRYYETDPYSGLPAVVPFDIKEGWYVAIKSTLPVLGNLRAYDDSGRASSFYVCNVGQNNREEFLGGDDICQGFYISQGTPPVFPGLSEQKAGSLMKTAIRAIEEATDQRMRQPSGLSKVSITSPIGEKQDINVGPPAANIPDIQCEDFMSPTDCNIMFNACDPFICPSSRCDLGGAYPVKDVVQSGVIGGLLLCLPNFPEVKIPICVSAVHAGVEGWKSVFESYEQCLQTSLDKGETVGICDEINSIYMCELVWRQGLPVVKYGVPKVFSLVFGQNVRGGGEYLTTQNAIENVGKSFDYFRQYYADNAYKAFKARSIENVGTELCRRYPSFVGPSGGNLLDAFTAPDSPPQFYGRFEEIPFTTATNPPASHYKVFYHIYAGKDFPAYYQVYLRGTGSSFYQDILQRPVASGVIPRGDFKTETKDFTAPSGYKELCIVVNGQEECGFKEVTTDLGLNLLTEEYVAREAARTDIDSEAKCVSGSPDAFSLLNPINIEQISSGSAAQGAAVAAGSEFGNPVIYNRGIIRVCATENPGKGTDSKTGTENSRWKQVGNCGSENLKCWLDTSSVKDVIRNTNTEERVLSEVTETYIDALQKEGRYINTTEFNSLTKEIENLRGKDLEVISKINEKIDKVFLNNQKGYLLLLRGISFGKIATADYYEFLNRQKNKDTFVSTNMSEDKQQKETETDTISCNDRVSCQIELGKKIIELARKKKESEAKARSISVEAFDARIREDTGANNFECLALQLAYHESGINHCGRIENGVIVDFMRNGNPLYCDGKIDEILKSSISNEESLGVMQINKEIYGEKLFFEENVNFGLDLLSKGYSDSQKIFTCTGKSYSGWARALRNYNGWGCTGDNRYVEDVIAKKSSVAALFPECASPEGANTALA